MSEPTELVLAPPTSAVRNTMEKGNEQTLENPNRPPSDASLREYCDKYYHQLLPIIAEEVHKEKAQKDKMKEVKARLNFEGCSERNSKIQEMSQHSESRTPNVRGDLERRRRSRRSRSMSRSPEPTSVFFRIRRDKSKSPRHGLGAKGIKEGGVFNRLGVREEVCPHTRRVVTRVSDQEKQNPSLEGVTMKEHLHGERNHSRRVKIAEEDTGSQDRKNKSRALKRTTYPNHGCARMENVFGF
nr:reverse transcriptase domain-containing protein [Tanacetum cinerariifolium]